MTRVSDGWLLFVLAGVLMRPVILCGQEPVVYPGGVVSAASYSTGGPAGNAIAPGSLAMIFGVNLAADSIWPDPLLLPTRLAGAQVTVGGIPAPLIYVSPNQINFQMPRGVSGPVVLLISTANGTSRPYPINAAEAFGVFSLGDAGCGPATALNSSGNGMLPANLPSSSISPGETLAIFGTGLYPVSAPPPDGVPASSNPLSEYSGSKGGTTFDLNGPYSPHSFAGLAAGLVAVDQVNVVVPEDAREGCAVPLLISAGSSGNSKPVTVSIRRGGGPCADPPAAAYGRIQWIKTMISGAATVTETDTVAVSFQESPGRQRPAAPIFRKGGPPVTGTQNLGRQCLVPGYRSLDAGTVLVQGPALDAKEATPASLGPPEDGQVAGLTQYFAVLPKGAIQPGSFRVAALGGKDIDAFESTVRIGAGIGIATPLDPGTTLHRLAPLVVNWTGGESGTWVTLRVVSRHGIYDEFRSTQAPVSDGTVTLSPEGLAAMPPGPVEVILEVVPEISSTLALPKLSLGGEHTWQYVYRFLGLTLD